MWLHYNNHNIGVHPLYEGHSTSQHLIDISLSGGHYSHLRLTGERCKAGQLRSFKKYTTVTVTPLTLPAGGRNEEDTDF